MVLQNFGTANGAVERKEDLMTFKNFEYVLVLATKPKDKPSVLDWCPFDDTTLDEIVNKHNTDHAEWLAKVALWPPKFC